MEEKHSLEGNKQEGVTEGAEASMITMDNEGNDQEQQSLMDIDTGNEPIESQHLAREGEEGGLIVAVEGKVEEGVGEGRNEATAYDNRREKEGEEEGYMESSNSSSHNYNQQQEEQEEQVGQTFRVLIERLNYQKPFLGGYRGHPTNREYHHAAAQTDCYYNDSENNNDEGKGEERGEEGEVARNATAGRRGRDPSKLRNRDTQTYEMVTRSIQTYREAGTQMARKDLHLDDKHDQFKEAAPYFTAASLLVYQHEKAIAIQRYWRGHAARARVWRIQNNRYQESMEASKSGREKKDQQDNDNVQEIHRRLHPRTQGDFRVLYNELEAWRKKETARAHQDLTLSEEDLKYVLSDLLDKEVKVLHTIDRLKLKAQKEWKLEREYRTLQLMSLPKQWQIGDGELADVHTTHTIRAQELLDLYKALNMTSLQLDSRLQVLLHIKWTIMEYDCSLTREIVELIDREADLLNRGRSEGSVEGLRLRLSNRFLEFVKTPSFNQEANRFRKVRKEKIGAVCPIRIGSSNGSRK